jgi:hypothetical protein
MVQQYNAGMGGVDLMDNMVACYRWEAVPKQAPVFLYGFLCSSFLYNSLFLFCRIPYRIKKWWFPIYSWSLSVSAVNAWRLRMSMRGTREPFLDFLRELCIAMFVEHGTAPVRYSYFIHISLAQICIQNMKHFVFSPTILYVRKRISTTGPAADARFDGIQHWIVATELDTAGKPKRRNCKLCSLSGKSDCKTLLMCEKCKVPLHIHCFKEGFLSSNFLVRF